MKPGYHLIGSRVGSPGGFKRYGSTGFNLYSPHRGKMENPVRVMAHRTLSTICRIASGMLGSFLTMTAACHGVAVTSCI
jgi:hypothetical protein